MNVKFHIFDKGTFAELGERELAALTSEMRFPDSTIRLRSRAALLRAGTQALTASVAAEKTRTHTRARRENKLQELRRRAQGR